MPTPNEKELQESYTWARSQVFSNYNRILGYYQAQACLENACGNSLLDMPCGDGEITSILAPFFTKVVGIDASSKHLELAKLKLPEFEFHESLIEDFETSERFSTVTLINILEHVFDPVVILKKAASFLDNKGILLVQVPNANAISRRLAVLMGTLTTCEELSPFDIKIAGHRRSYSMNSFCADFEKAGLKIVKTGGVFYKSLSTPQMDWFLKNGLWTEGGFGWGRVDTETPQKDWRKEFCRASYELGKQNPEDCNIIYVCAKRMS